MCNLDWCLDPPSSPASILHYAQIKVFLSRFFLVSGACEGVANTMNTCLGSQRKYYQNSGEHEVIMGYSRQGRFQENSSFHSRSWKLCDHRDGDVRYFRQGKD